jgi:RNA polymerase sigma factor (sigma-70 family)
MTTASLKYSLETADQTEIDWSKALQEHRRWLATVIQSRLSDRQAAEDVLQEVVLAAIVQSSRPTDPSKIAPWLYRIALRKVINHHRSTGRRRRLIERAVALGQLQKESVTKIPGEWMMQSEQAITVSQAMESLEPQDRQILLLKYTEDWGYQELSEHLGISIKTVEYRLLKARRALRAKLCETN